eukprot:gnl/MRDRNA2_/MRDRNA2_137902_c0_seq1.p1 gnl/MRDRNA2_/MRDRNA2_137902_c0~~gnl/MRDRNA2_/MRDRNA2_137902_c0_seq1.p1  ORF type:complete len:733 (+),score=169.75 gnl/MRDRNA2_/MRDRNA2_137902_c0_seq1:46-2244(+)
MSWITPGTAVDACFYGEWYPAVYRREIGQDLFEVQWQDGTISHLDEHLLRPQWLAVGALVYASFYGEWHAATVYRLLEHGVVEIEWDSEDTISHVHPRDLCPRNEVVTSKAPPVPLVKVPPPSASPPPLPPTPLVPPSPSGSPQVIEESATPPVEPASSIPSLPEEPAHPPPPPPAGSSHSAYPPAPAAQLPPSTSLHGARPSEQAPASQVKHRGVFHGILKLRPKKKAAPSQAAPLSPPGSVHHHSETSPDLLYAPPLPPPPRPPKAASTTLLQRLASSNASASSTAAPSTEEVIAEAERLVWMGESVPVSAIAKALEYEGEKNEDHLRHILGSARMFVWWDEIDNQWMVQVKKDDAPKMTTRATPPSSSNQAYPSKMPRSSGPKAAEPSNENRAEASNASPEKSSVPVTPPREKVKPTLASSLPTSPSSACKSKSSPTASQLPESANAGLSRTQRRKLLAAEKEKQLLDIATVSTDYSSTVSTEYSSCAADEQRPILEVPRNLKSVPGQRTSPHSKATPKKAKKKRRQKQAAGGGAEENGDSQSSEGEEREGHDEDEDPLRECELCDQPVDGANEDAEEIGLCRMHAREFSRLEVKLQKAAHKARGYANALHALNSQTIPNSILLDVPKLELLVDWLIAKGHDPDEEGYPEGTPLDNAVAMCTDPTTPKSLQAVFRTLAFVLKKRTDETMTFQETDDFFEAATTKKKDPLSTISCQALRKLRVLDEKAKE